MRIVVNEQTWLRGSSGESYLRNGEGKMCCLGFACLQGGLTEAEIQNMTMPGRLSDNGVRIPPVLSFLVDKEFNRLTSSLLAHSAATVNDMGTLTDDVRKAELKAIFNAQGHDIVFVNDPDDYEREVALSIQLAKSDHHG